MPFRWDELRLFVGTIGAVGYALVSRDAIVAYSVLFAIAMAVVLLTRRPS